LGKEEEGNARKVARAKGSSRLGAVVDKFLLLGVVEGGANGKTEAIRVQGLPKQVADRRLPLTPATNWNVVA